MTVFFWIEHSIATLQMLLRIPTDFEQCIHLLRFVVEYYNNNKTSKSRLVGSHYDEDGNGEKDPMRRKNLCGLSIRAILREIRIFGSRGTHEFALECSRHICEFGLDGVTSVRNEYMNFLGTVIRERLIATTPTFPFPVAVFAHLCHSFLSASDIITLSRIHRRMWMYVRRHAYDHDLVRVVEFDSCADELLRSWTMTKPRSRVHTMEIGVSPRRMMLARTTYPNLKLIRLTSGTRVSNVQVLVISKGKGDVWLGDNVQWLQINGLRGIPRVNSPLTRLHVIMNGRVDWVRLTPHIHWHPCMVIDLVLSSDEEDNQNKDGFFRQNKAQLLRLRTTNLLQRRSRLIVCETSVDVSDHNYPRLRDRYALWDGLFARMAIGQTIWYIFGDETHAVIN